MQVQTQDAIRDETDTVAGRLQKDLQDKKIVTPSRSPVGRARADDSLLVTLPAPEGVDEAMKSIDLYARGWTRETVEAGKKFRVTMPRSMQNETRDSAVNATLETIRTRVSQFGVAEEVINRRAPSGGGFSDRIVLELPGVENPERVKELIKSQAKLEWKEMTYPPSVPGRAVRRSDQRAGARRALRRALPPDTQAYPQPTGTPGADGKESCATGR
jgi:preprotein translocase subunit SecD